MNVIEEVKPLPVFRLEPVDGISKIAWLGDLHDGYKTTNKKFFEKVVKYCVDNKIYVVGQGDYAENATKTSPGNSLYEQRENVNSQFDEVFEYYWPLAENKLLLGMHDGNHENRTKKLSGYDPVYRLCKELKVPYFGAIAYYRLLVGSQGYNVVSQHGTGNDCKLSSKIKSATDKLNDVWADISVVGHNHEPLAHPIQKVIFNPTTKQVVTENKWIVLSGSFLGYFGSYGESSNYSPNRTGSVLVELGSKERTILGKISEFQKCLKK